MAYNVKQKLNSMSYKDFTWEYNPATCTYSCSKKYVAHKYPELAGVELEDMDADEVVIIEFDPAKSQQSPVLPCFT